ncbi:MULTISPECIES: hypothetical protein [unclassified Modestobacter]|nr:MULTISPECIES: hypothetical protein [unclassified Modestobacter]MCZ2814393.1 hypothetical protein [Modestobacter sp. VKM Ac-2979]MCZ2843915.1 hypothetical protein [Modestobacter sp. VKM Ac-2980]MCZ2850594.1 hypothetical protein [Modestobacter sp. VKM Ac-2978]
MTAGARAAVHLPPPGPALSRLRTTLWTPSVVRSGAAPDDGHPAS